MLNLSVSTYGSIELSAAELGEQTPASLAELPWARAGVAQIRATRFGVELGIGAFAGSLVIPGVASIEITELVPGTAAACLRIATRGWRVADQEAPSSGSRLPPVVAVALNFLKAARTILQVGPEKVYETTVAVSQRPRGRILALPTALIASRGKPTMAVSRHRRLTSDTPANRVILGAARRAELLLQHTELVGETRLARIIQRQLSDVSDWGLTDIAIATRDAQTPHESSVAMNAEVLLRGVPFTKHDDRSSSAFDAWVNLDAVFEQAMLMLITEVSSPGDSVGRGSVHKRLTLNRRASDGAGQVKRANPDVVISRGEDCVIADAKYRRTGRLVTDDSVYQLITHADAFTAREAALIVPNVNSPCGVFLLGVDPLGRAIKVVVVDPTDISAAREVLKRWLKESFQYKKLN